MTYLKKKGGLGSEATLAIGVVVGCDDQSLRLTSVSSLPPFDDTSDHAADLPVV